MAAPVIDRMTTDDFLAWESEQERKFELVNGAPVMMTGASRAHDGVRLNLLGEFRSALRGKSCRAHLDIKVVCPTGNIRYPDALIDCGTYIPRDVVAPAPTIVVEVLSPSTRATDFFAKVRDYESVPSISTYAIFWQDEPRAVVYRRQGERLISAETLEGVNVTVVFSDVGVSVAMADVYEDVFPPDAPIV